MPDTATAPAPPAAGTTPAPAGRGSRARAVRQLTPVLGVLPFTALVVLFLLIPTLVVIIGSFLSGNQLTLLNLQGLTNPVVVGAFEKSIELSAITAVVGAALGGLLAHAVSTARRDGLLRRVVTAGSGVLAQFGGVTLAFAFTATLGSTGVVTRLLADQGVVIPGGGLWLYELPGLVLVYSYFQIPLMVIVFLPALDGLRAQWREASDSLGGSTWQYWRHVGGPVLLPSFLGSMLLLFANAFSAYATAAALVTQGSIIVPLQIRGALSSEVVLGQADLGKALALGMIVVVALVMTAYALLQRRTSRWLS